MSIQLVTLNGSRVRYVVRDTNEGRQVLVVTSCGGGHTWRLRVITG